MWRKAELAIILLMSALLIVTLAYPVMDAADEGEGSIEPSDHVLYDQDGWKITLKPNSDGNYVIYDTDSVENVANRLNVEHNEQPVTDFSLTGGGGQVVTTHYPPTVQISHFMWMWLSTKL